ncbi:MAG: hypothetical protein ACE14M_13415 [Terriglobales bacterium]
MIRSAAGCHKFYLLRAGHTEEIGPEFFLAIFGDLVSTFSGAENAMQKNLLLGLSHLGPSLRDSDSLLTHVPALKRWANECRRYAAGASSALTNYFYP